MRRHRRIARLIPLFGMLALAAGCQSRSYRIDLDMPPNNVATATIKGSSPFVMVSNRGPGSVFVTFDVADEDGEGLGGEREELIRGTTGRTMHGSKVVKVETGPDEPAKVTLSAQRSGGIKLNGPVPAAR